MKRLLDSARSLSLSRLALAAMLLAFLAFQLLTLNHPRLSSDEVISGILGLEHLSALLSGKWPGTLTPVQPYLGPLDAWILGAMTWVAFHFPGIEPMPWLLRIIPFAWTCVGAWGLAREAFRRSSELGWWTLATSLAWPMSAVHGKVGWAPAFCLGTFSLLAAEGLRASRTSKPRWVLMGVLAGASIQLHPVSALGVLAVLIAEHRALWRAFRTSPGKPIAAAAVAVTLALPEILNFPPPVDIGAPGGILELRAIFNVITGEQPIHWWYHREVSPVPVLMALGFFMIGLFLWRWTKLLARNEEAKPGFDIRSYTLAGVAAAGVLLYFCFKGRSLLYHGHERYLLSVVPLWNLLIAEALTRLGEGWPLRRIEALTLAFTAFQVSRLVVSSGGLLDQEDPVLTASRWLERECPRERCVAYADHFWNYWVTRYYTRDRLDLNCQVRCVKERPKIEAQGRYLAGCWYADTKKEESDRWPKRWEKRIAIPAADTSVGLECFGKLEF